MKYIDAAIRESAKQSTMSFEELVQGCTPDEREQLAWRLAMLRARRTVEALAKSQKAVPLAPDVDRAREIIRQAVLVHSEQRKKPVEIADEVIDDLATGGFVIVSGEVSDEMVDRAAEAMGCIDRDRCTRLDTRPSRRRPPCEECMEAAKHALIAALKGTP